MTIPRKYSTLSRGTPLRSVNVERHEREWTRAYHSLERVAFVKSLPCIVPGCRAKPCDNAHIANDGKGRKGDYTLIVPACRTHHEELDNGDGRSAFEAMYGLSLAEHAAETEKAWLEFSAEQPRDFVVPMGVQEAEVNTPTADRGLCAERSSVGFLEPVRESETARLGTSLDLLRVGFELPEGVLEELAVSTHTPVETELASFSGGDSFGLIAKFAAGLEQEGRRPLIRWKRNQKGVIDGVAVVEVA